MSIKDRIERLEQAAQAGEVVFAKLVRADGSLVPLKPGQWYGPLVIRGPEECATAEEWLARRFPRGRE